MATIEHPRLAEPLDEVAQSKALAARYRCEFVDLKKPASITTCSIRCRWT